MEKVSQIQRMYTFLSDRRPHRTDEILKEVYGSEHFGIARIGARIYDIKKKFGVTIECRRGKQSQLYWYKMV